MYVCWKHFSPSDFKNEIDDESIAQLRFGHLKLNAIPSQNLPEDSDPITINGEITKKVQNRCEICEKDLKSRSKLLVHQRSCKEHSEKGSKETLDKELAKNIGTKFKEVIMETSSDHLGFQNNEELKNPWKVKDASVFLKYCCPECVFNDPILQCFADHSLTHHPNSSSLFIDENSIELPNTQIYIKAEEGCRDWSGHSQETNGRRDAYDLQGWESSELQKGKEVWSAHSFYGMA